MTDPESTTPAAGGLHDFFAPLAGALDGMRDAFAELPADGHRSISVSAVCRAAIGEVGLITFTISAGEAPDLDD